MSFVRSPHNTPPTFALNLLSFLLVHQSQILATNSVLKSLASHLWCYLSQRPHFLALLFFPLAYYFLSKHPLSFLVLVPTQFPSLLTFLEKSFRYHLFLPQEVYSSTHYFWANLIFSLFPFRFLSIFSLKV